MAPRDVSAPLAALLPRGAAPADVTELALGGGVGGHGLAALVEPCVNLEVLWAQGNNLTSLSGLAAPRQKQLYAHVRARGAASWSLSSSAHHLTTRRQLQDNAIATLKGVAGLRHLEVLDLGGNRLRGLDRVLRVLARLRCLRELTLAGNPCAEEAGYRLQVVAALPALELLDHHQVTPAERRQAAAERGGRAALAAAVAFGVRAPPARAPAVRQERSVLEQELGETAARVRSQRAAEAEAALGAAADDAAFWERRARLPPPPGVARAREAPCPGAGPERPPSPSAAAYKPRDVLLLHSLRSRSDGGAGPGAGGAGDAPRFQQGTHSHHLAARRWEAQLTALSL
ncbi:LRRC72 [Scenedesmus sp. PABB004]|nr:LRRC72 [Scenedesmus sp. PABB004]